MMLFMKPLWLIRIALRCKAFDESVVGGFLLPRKPVLSNVLTDFDFDGVLGSAAR